MRPPIKAYAASTPRAPLELFSFDPGEIGPEEVETWARPLPDALDLAKAGPLLCGGITVFSPLLQHNLLPTAKVGVIGIGGLGHMALQFANKFFAKITGLGNRQGLS